MIQRINIAGVSARELDASGARAADRIADVRLCTRILKAAHLACAMPQIRVEFE